MNLKSLKTSMDFYYELTRSSILLLDLKSFKPEIYYCGLNWRQQCDVFELKELIQYLNNHANHLFLDEHSKNYFIGYQTQSNFLYNIIFVSSSENSTYFIISGPMLTGFPSLEQINLYAKDTNLPWEERQAILQALYHLPKFSTKKIASLGKLLVILIHNNTTLPGEIKQILPKKQYQKEPVVTHSNDKIDTFDINILFHFLMKIEKELLQEKSLDISDVIQENISDLNELIHKYDNLYSLKSYSLILCTTSYFHALHSAMSFEFLFRKLWDFVEKLGPLHTYEDVISLMAQTLSDFGQLMFFEDKTYSPHVNQILKYVKLHYREKITLDDLAEQFHISCVYISHIIKKETNLTLSDHINLTRIQHSKMLLAHSEKSISEIAFSLGYNYQSHFTKAFKKYTNQTPSQYRAQETQNAHFLSF